MATRRPDVLVVATRNPHKLQEFGRLLGPFGIALEPLGDDARLPPETGATFAENALAKARAAATAMQRPAIADDSGIEAEDLAGAPGVRSARYAGPHATDAENLEKLMREAAPGSGLRYVCALAYCEPLGGEERVFFGDCVGRLAPAARGSRGFGYDPVFLADAAGHNRTMAELSNEEKDSISHRGHAARKLMRWLGQ